VFNNHVSDVAWSPDSTDFIVISGKMPAVVTMYTKNCLPYFEFGKIHVNTIRYSHDSALVCFGGFGALAGEMQFWDKDELVLLGVNQSHCAVTCEWAPDSRHILTAVLFPRVRVDNELNVFNYYGKRLTNIAMDKSGE